MKHQIAVGVTVAIAGIVDLVEGVAVDFTEIVVGICNVWVVVSYTYTVHCCCHMYVDFNVAVGRIGRLCCGIVRGTAVGKRNPRYIWGSTLASEL